MILIIVLVVSLFAVAYAKRRTKINGIGKIDAAGIKCYTEVIPNNSSIESINPYCEINVNNFDENNEVSEFAFDYEITIESETNNLPDYYCIDSLGNEIANSTSENTQIIGTLGCESSETQTYRLYFVNDGENDVTQNFSLRIKTMQVNN